MLEPYTRMNLQNSLKDKAVTADFPSANNAKVKYSTQKKIHFSRSFPRRYTRMHSSCGCFYQLWPTLPDTFVRTYQFCIDKGQRCTGMRRFYAGAKCAGKEHLYTGKDQKYTVTRYLYAGEKHLYTGTSHLCAGKEH